MAEYNPSKIIKDGNTYNFRDTTKIPLSGSNQISGSLIPATTDAYDLGGSSYQWNNAYIKNYYYNGTAWGLDKQNEWTNFQRMISNPTVWYLRNNTVTLGTAPSSNRYIGMFFEDVNGADLGHVSFQANKNGHNSIMFNLRNYDGTNAYTGVLRYRVSTTGAYCFFPEISECDLGISTNKWKTLNGINPGALSLPSNSYVNVDTTNWDVAGGTNVYTPPANGWLHIRVAGATELMVRWTGWGFGDRRVSATATDLGVTIPVVAGVTVDVVTVASGFDGKCQFFPCQGNV